MQVTTHDEIAEWYDEQVRAGGFFVYVLPPLLELVGEVRGQRICDLACGQGQVARPLAARGASVVGIDLSQRLLELARQQAATDGQPIVYRSDDAQAGATLAYESFDGVVCNLALMDNPNLQATVRTAFRILRPGDWFVFSITHPFTQVPGSGRVLQSDGTIKRLTGAYFGEGFWRPVDGPGVRACVCLHQRTLSTYLNTIIQAGFRIERLVEPRASGPAPFAITLPTSNCPQP